MIKRIKSWLATKRHTEPALDILERLSDGSIYITRRIKDGKILKIDYQYRVMEDGQYRYIRIERFNEDRKFIHHSCLSVEGELVGGGIIHANFIEFI